MDEKEKLSADRERLRGAVGILIDVSDAIRAGLDFMGIIKRWQMFNPDVKGVEECLRQVYPDELDYLVSVLNNEFSLNISTERVRHSAHSLDCVAVLESLRDRIKTYKHMYPYYPEEYLEKLAAADRAGLDKAISILKSLDQ